MKLTKIQKEKLYNASIGYGWIVFKSGKNEITEIETYIGKDNILRRVENGKPLLPIELRDEDGNLFECKKAI